MIEKADVKKAEAGADAASGSGASSSSDAVSDLLAGRAEHGVAHGVAHYVNLLAHADEAAATQGARAVEAFAEQKPDLLAPHIEALVAGLYAEHANVVHAAAAALPVLARVVPAKVAKQLPALVAQVDAAPSSAKDALLRTFVGLCLASVTYQRRLIDVFQRALQKADDTLLPDWSAVILPALKGEPYALARGVVEARLSDPDLPRPLAQRIADQLGIKLRPLPPRP
jgi:predicted negative regulator of RcsB-dependent stress response